MTALYELIPIGERLDVPGIDPLKYQRPANLSASASRDEALTVKLRYKEPDGASSNVISVAVPSRTDMTPALGFAAAVAEFGMVLDDSEFKGSSSYAGAIDLATMYKSADAYGHRAEFVRLVQGDPRNDVVLESVTSTPGSTPPPASRTIPWRCPMLLWAGTNPEIRSATTSADRDRRMGPPSTGTLAASADIDTAPSCVAGEPKWESGNRGIE